MCKPVYVLSDTDCCHAGRGVDQLTCQRYLCMMKLLCSLYHCDQFKNIQAKQNTPQTFCCLLVLALSDKYLYCYRYAYSPVHGMVNFSYFNIFITHLGQLNRPHCILSVTVYDEELGRRYQNMCSIYYRVASLHIKIFFRHYNYSATLQIHLTTNVIVKTVFSLKV